MLNKVLSTKYSLAGQDSRQYPSSFLQEIAYKLAHKNVVKKINQFTIPLSFIYHSNNLQFEEKNYLFKHFNETL